MVDDHAMLRKGMALLLGEEADIEVIGDATLDDAQKIKAELIALGDDIGDAGALGDSFMLQNYFPQKDQTEIQKQFGSGFTESLIALAPGQWRGPVLSGYGVHLVYVQAVSEPPAPKFANHSERPGARIEHATYKSSGAPLAGQSIAIDGLTATQTDVLLLAAMKRTANDPQLSRIVEGFESYYKEDNRQYAHFVDGAVSDAQLHRYNTDTLELLRNNRDYKRFLVSLGGAR